MLIINKDIIETVAAWPAFVSAIEAAVLDGDYESPSRMVLALHDAERGGDGNLLIMPAWRMPEFIGLKTVTFWPENPQFGEASHGANYILMDGRSGRIVALIDGHELTARRTAAVSVVAAKRLLRQDAKRLLVIGTGPIARMLVLAHASWWPFSSIEIYGRQAQQVERLVADLTGRGISCAASSDLEASVAAADMISTATSATAPLFAGEAVRPGTHLDLVGSFKPTMREVDDVTMSRAGQIWVDNAAAVTDSGDLTQPLASKAIGQQAICGDLARLVSAGAVRQPGAITVFKSVGFATPDLAVAQTILKQTMSAETLASPALARSLG